MSHCHCNQCRKGHGAAFASYGSVPRGALRILNGAGHITAYSSSESVLREFCALCGSTLFWSRSQGECSDWVSIALGTFDTPFTPQKQNTLMSLPEFTGTHHPTHRLSWINCNGRFLLIVTGKNRPKAVVWSRKIIRPNFPVTSKRNA
nr:GFA family protein [Pseudomonas sp. RIT-PI-q]